MTLPASGPISLSQVNTELSRSSTALIDMNDSSVRTLAGVGGSGTVISMQNLLNKNSAVLSFNNVNNFSLQGEYFSPAFISFLSNGQISISAGAIFTGPTQYFSPTVAANGINFEIQVSYSVDILGAGSATILGTQIFSSASGVVLFTSLSTAQTIQVETPNPYDDPISVSFNVVIRRIGTSETISRSGLISID